ncbi:MAG: TraB/GumN family protein [Allosphingosinicella sp.]|uniref:TraB/GumN family protein n=1 Tax=Allosphingosinicella sp. TaxID=2823234 RepID=UPI003935AF72
MAMKGLKALAARWLALTAAALLAGCATAERPAAPAAAAQGGAPAMWKVADADTTIYLFGTIHALPEGVNWRTPAFEQAFAAADELVIEVKLGEDPAEASRAMMRMGMAPGLPPLIERVPEADRPALRAMIAASGLPAPLLDGMKSWAAGLTLAAAAFHQMGIATGHGVEQGLYASAAGARKPVIGLETAEQQFGFFDGLSEEAQRVFLAGMAADRGDLQAQFQAMLDAWLSGDTDAIARTFDSEFDAHPELHEALLARRNAAWADWVKARLARPGTSFVAVGAGHLAGRDSLQDMLAARGVAVERVQ